MRKSNKPYLIFGIGLACYLLLKSGVLWNFTTHDQVTTIGSVHHDNSEHKLVDARGRTQWALPGRFGHDHQHAFAGGSFSYVAHHVKGALPDATDLLTHLKARPNNTLLETSNLVGKQVLKGQGRTGVFLTVGIAHTSKHETRFFNHMIKSLLMNVTLEESRNCSIIVLLCDLDQKYNLNALKRLQADYSKQVDAGLLEVVVIPRVYYPDFQSLASGSDRGGDSLDSFILRCKEILDASFLMNYAQSRTKYLAAFSDDVVAKPGYLGMITNFLKNPPRTNWYFVRFTTRDSLTKNVLLRSEDCPKFVNFFLTFYKAWRIENLYEDFLVVLCRRCAGRYYSLRLDFPQEILTTVPS